MKKAHKFSHQICKNVLLLEHESVALKAIEFLTSVKDVSDKWFPIHTGKYKGKEVTVIATGMGSANTAIAVDEAIASGAEKFMRFGSFGALISKIQVGDAFVPYGAIRTDGVGAAYAPMEFPAVPDISLAKKLEEECRKKGLTTHEGVVWSSDVYKPVTEGTSRDHRFSYYTWKELGAIGIEMECAPLFITAKHRGACAAALLICNRTWKTQEEYLKGKDVEWREHRKNPIYPKKTSDGLQAALEALVKS